MKNKSEVLAIIGLGASISILFGVVSGAGSIFTPKQPSLGQMMRKDCNREACPKFTNLPVIEPGIFK